ncbi:protein toll-like [Pieris brassicae]|uniref:protein toll-like n=1 Tax=Pieris brassicae TaxID=7116 RepID=UPI001E661777|nr:protein toll-like [Pieris brassicae]XP_045525652.1 protein toll-like [Pieris brassicae]XP_045525653.1 protein toll-like [Pieris brassicae]
MICLSLLLVLLGSSSHGQSLNNTALDIQYPLGYEPMALTWIKPNGCAVQSVPGKVEVTCSLPAGEVVVKVSANSVSLRCEDKTFICKELTEVRSHISKRSASPNIRLLVIENCVLPDEELSCVLDAVVGAKDAKVLMFEDLKSNITQRHLAGLKEVTNFQIRGCHNTIEMPYDALSTLPNLTRVLIQYAALHLTNETGAILTIKHLTLLDIKLNSMIPDGAFKRTPFLSDLMIIGQKPSLEIDEHAFDDLPHLVNISLNSNNLRSLPERVFSKNRLLESIELYDNSLETLHPSVFSGLSRLTEVKMFSNSQNVLFQAQDGLFSNLPSLKLVDIHDTRLSDVPENLFSNSTNIKKLFMSACDIKTLPEKLFLNLNLESLDLSFNEIEELPSKVFNGQDKLMKLNLSRNKIKVLPDGLFIYLMSLKILDMRENNIEDLNDYVFEDLLSLQELYLNKNQITRLRHGTFNPLRHLKVLSLARNSIVQYSEGILNLLDLHSLDLSYNRITTVYDVWFPLVFLQDLNLSHNSITELDRINFDNRTRVDLRYNKITYVDLILQPEISTESLAASLPDLLLDYNPFDCNCSLYAFINLTSNKSVTRIHINDAKCSKPNELSDHKLTDLSVDMLTCDYPFCPDGCSCTERIAMKKVEFTCTSLPEFQELSRSSPDTVLRLESYTHINGLPPYVKLLNVSGLNITDFEPVLFNPIEIDLSDNALIAAPQLLHENVTLNLLNNPLKCDCEHKDGLRLLKRFNKKLKYYAKLTCENGDYIETKDIDQICSLKSQVTYSLVALAAVCLVGVAIFLTYRNVVIIRIILRKYGFQLYTDLGDYEYDAFISFAQEDVAIVEDIVKKLESGSQPLKLCVHSRNWIPGEMIVDQIERSVERSRWTIIVLSHSFIKSYWAKIEYLTAHSKSKLLVLILDDVHESESLSPEIKLYIKSTTYTHYSNPYAVERLRDAVLRQPKWPELVGKKKDGEKGVKKEGKLRGALDVQINVDGQLVNQGRL